MPTILHSDALTNLAALSSKITRADTNVGNALTNFGREVDALNAMTAPGSAESQLIANVIETADLAENADNSAWQARKEEALLAQADIAARLASYVAALPQLQALRNG